MSKTQYAFEPIELPSGALSGSRATYSIVDLKSSTQLRLGFREDVANAFDQHRFEWTQPFADVRNGALLLMLEESPNSRKMKGKKRRGLFFPHIPAFIELFGSEGKGELEIVELEPARMVLKPIPAAAAE